MSHNAALSKKRIILPFATPSENRYKDFTENMEMAAIMCLAESKRDKGESPILRRQDEKLVFIAEVCYPIWLIPNQGTTLIFDGLNLNSTVLSYDIVPDAKVFNSDIRSNKGKTEVYDAILKENIDYFRAFASNEDTIIEGLVTTPDLVRDLAVYMTQVKEAKKSLKNKILLPKTVEKSQIRASINQLSTLKKRALNDIEDMDETTILLNGTTKKRIKIIREEIRKLQERCDRQIAETRARNLKKTWRTQSRYNRKSLESTRKFRDKTKALENCLLKLQKTRGNLEAEVKRIKRQYADTNRKNRVQLTPKLNRIRKKLASIKETIKRKNKKLRTLQATEKLELHRQKVQFEKQMKAINEVLQALQTRKNAEIKAKRQEILQLEDYTHQITNLIQRLVKAKRASLIELEEIGLSRSMQKKGLVYIPFYLARYDRGDNRRYVTFPPSSIEDMGILTRVKGLLGAARMTALLQPRSKTLSAFLNRTVLLIAEDPMVEKFVTEAGIRDSILLKKQLRIRVKRGLKKLESEKWITKDELQTFSRFLYVYA